MNYALRIFICLMWLSPSLIVAQSYGTDSLYAEYSFDVDGSDAFGNVDFNIGTGASIINDTERGSNVVALDATTASAGIVSGGELIPAGVDSITFSTWLYWDSASDGNWISIFSFGSRANVDGYHYLGTRIGGQGIGFVQNGAAINGSSWKSVNASAGVSPSQDQWTHIAFTIAGRSISIYMDGDEVASGSLNANLSEIVKDTFMLGEHIHRTGLNITGRFDDTRIYHSALTPGQIVALAGGATFETTIQVNLDGMPLDGATIKIGSAEYITDINGNANLGSFAAGTQSADFIKDYVLGSEEFEILSDTVISFNFSSPVINSDKQLVYQNAAAWYSFDVTEVDSMGGQSFNMVNTLFEADPDRGFVATTTGDESYMTLDNTIAVDEDYSVTFWYRWDEQGLPPWRIMYAMTNRDTPEDIGFYLTPYHGFTTAFEFPTFSSIWADETATNDIWHLMESGELFESNRWFHLGLVYSNGGVSLYVDGQFKESQVYFTTNESLQPSEISLGHIPLRPSTSFMPAAYDDMAIFDYALRPEEVEAIFDNEVYVPGATEKYLIEVEDYAFGDWETTRAEGRTYIQFTGQVNEEAFTVENALTYGLIDIPAGNNGAESYDIWAYVKTDSDISRAFNIKEGDGIEAIKTKGVDSTDWKWEKIYTTTFIEGTPFQLQFSPASSELLIDKLIITLDKSFDPDTYTEEDTSAPSVPGNFNVIEAGNGATFTWTESTDDTGIIAYQIMNGDEILSTTRERAITLSLPASTSYEFSVRALDAAGNISGTSNTSTFTTDQLSFTLDYSDQQQTIDHFASSDGWGAEFIATSWTEATREKFAEILFSTEIDDAGNPVGIGLSSWRVNIGNGSIISGGITANQWRTLTEIVRDESGNYDWTKQAGTQWFMSRARDYGTNHFVGWITSPPYYWTQNGYTFRTAGVVDYNIQADKYDDFAEYLATFTKHFEDQGFNFKAISPVNEPQYEWSAEVGQSTQSGSRATNENIETLVNAIHTAFVAQGVNAKIALGESGSYQFLSSNAAGSASNQIFNFWNTNGANYLGDLSTMEDVITGHSYFNSSTLANLVNNRIALRDALTANNNSGRDLGFWQTEYSILGSEHLDAEGRTEEDMTDIDYALWLARIIHADMAYANASAWSWWATFSRVRSGAFLQRFGLFNFDMEQTDIVTPTNGKSRHDHWYRISKNLYALGQYSRFVRPGMVRIGTGRSDNQTELQEVSNQMLTAYVDEESGDMSLVIINYADIPQRISIGTSNFPVESNIGSFKIYVTSESENLKFTGEQGLDELVYLPARSIVTLSGNFMENKVDAMLTINETAPLVGGEITFNNRTFFTEDDGSVDLGIVPDGSYDLVLKLDTINETYTFNISSDTLLTINQEVAIDTTQNWNINAIITVNDQPFEGAQLTLEDSVYITNGNGFVSFGAIVEDSYIVDVSIDTLSRSFGFFASSDSTFTFNIEFDSTIYWNADAIFKVNDQPFEGATINLNDLSLITNGEGEVALGTLAEGDYNIQFVKDTLSQDFTFSLTSDSTFTFNIEFDSTIYWNADVIFTVNDQPFEGATININDLSLTTNGDGQVALGTLAEGDYEIQFVKDTLTKDFSFNLMSDSIFTFNIEFDSTIFYDVEATFTINDTEPWEGASIMFGDLDITTGADGKVSLGSLTSGDYSLVASKDDNNATFNFTVDSDTLLTFNLEKTVLSTQQEFNTQVYPNPVTGMLTLESPEGILSVRLTNIDGKELNSYTGSGQQKMTIDVSDVEAGVFILLIESKVGVATHRLSKE